jgi:hypothetical protein
MNIIWIIFIGTNEYIGTDKWITVFCSVVILRHISVLVISFVGLLVKLIIRPQQIVIAILSLHWPSMFTTIIVRPVLSTSQSDLQRELLILQNTQESTLVLRQQYLPLVDNGLTLEDKGLRDGEAVVSEGTFVMVAVGPSWVALGWEASGGRGEAISIACCNDFYTKTSKVHIAL